MTADVPNVSGRNAVMSGLSDSRPSIALRRVVVAALLIALAFVGLAPSSAEAAPLSATPTISGTARVGLTLKAKVKWTPRWYTTVQWLRDGKKIKNATHESYKLTPADFGKKISVRATASRYGYRSVTKTSKKTKKVGLGTMKPWTPNLGSAPRIDWSVDVTAGFHSPQDAKKTYQWLRDGKKIKGATKRSYTPVAADVGRKLSVTVTGTRKGYKKSTVTTKPKKVAPGELWGIQVWVDSDPGWIKAGDTVTARPGEWSPTPTFSYQWLRDSKAISGATAETYRLTEADGGTQISVRVTGSRAGYPSLTLTSESRYVSGPGDLDLGTLPQNGVRNCVAHAVGISSYGLFTRAQAESITSLTCSKWERVETLEGFPDLPNLTKLVIEGESLTSFRGLPSLPRLETLVVYDNPIVEFEGLPKLANLKSLVSWRSSASSLAALVEKTPALDHLVFQPAPEVTDLSRFPELADLPHLTQLGVTHSEINTLEGMPALPNLELFGVVFSKLSDLRGMPDLPRLSTLLLQVNKRLTSLEGMPALPALSRLRLNHSGLTSVGGLANRTGLKELWVHDNPLVDPAADKAALQPLVAAGCVIHWEQPV